MTTTDLVLDALACYRLTRLGVDDSLLDEPRNAVLAWTNPNGRQSLLQRKVEELIGCPWCLSMWLAFVVVLLRRRAPRLWAPLARALAFSAVTGMVSVGVDLAATTSEAVAKEEEVEVRRG